MSDIKYGAITRIDADCIEAVLRRFTGTVRFIEIGMYRGDTARGVKAYCDSIGLGLDYWGIDAIQNSPSEPFPGAHYVVKPSEEAWQSVPSDVDIVFVDACHCVNHVILDAVHYGCLVKAGGYILFHDSTPSQQHVMKNRWVHGEEDLPIHLTAVRDALEKLGWPNCRFEKIMDDFDPAADIGGIMAFRKK